LLNKGIESARQEVWCNIFEKALAKLYGSYSRLETGNIAEVYTMLTGAPSVIYNHSELEENPWCLYEALSDEDQ